MTPRLRLSLLATSYLGLAALIVAFTVDWLAIGVTGGCILYLNLFRLSRHLRTRSRLRFLPPRLMIWLPAGLVVAGFSTRVPELWIAGLTAAACHFANSFPFPRAYYSFLHGSSDPYRT